MLHSGAPKETLTQNWKSASYKPKITLKHLYVWHIPKQQTSNSLILSTISYSGLTQLLLLSYSTLT